jgi:two-component system nitrate/nitrite response regulator NarL
MAPPRRIRVFLADGHPLFLESLASAVRERPGLDLAGAARNGLEALEDLRRLRPDIVVVDARIGRIPGAELIATGTRERIGASFVVLSAQLDDDLVYDTFAAGAAAYLSKEMDRDEILDAVMTVAAGGVVIAPAVQSGLIRELRRRDVLQRPRLSARELEVLALAAEGLSTRQIAGSLHLSPATVRTHLQKTYEKLGVADRTSAVVVALRRGLLE